MKDYKDFLQIESLTDLEEVINNSDACLLYFYNDNCAPCISMRPKVIELIENEFHKIKLVFINSINRELPAKYNVYDNPTLLIFFDKKEYIRKSKYVSMAELKLHIERYYNLMF